MKVKLLVGVAGSILVCAASARAEWGYGLNREVKTIYVPCNQQSGWWGCVDFESKAPSAPKKAEPKPVEPKKIAAQPAPTPVPTPVETKMVPEKEWVLSGVVFEIGSDKLKKESESSLNEAVGILSSHPKVRVEIQGHTDNTGNSAANQSLSERRAQSVKSYLVGHGIEAGRLETKGYGASAPKADNKTAEGRAANRRIEFKVLSR